MNKEVAKLFLSSGNLTTTQSSIGVRNSTNTSFTWFVDMRNVLGETLFNNYERYKVYIQFNQNPSVAELQTYYLEGLNFIQTSNQGMLTVNKVPIMSNYNNLNSATKPIINGFTMIKPNANLTPITISIESNDGSTPAGNQYVAVVFTFAPISEDKLISPYEYCYKDEQVNFTLSTQALTANATNQYGTMNTNKSIFTFTNINMRNIIGTLWDKYDKFNLQIRTIGVGAFTTAISGANRRMYFKISGLQFINNMVVENSIDLNSIWTPLYLNEPTTYSTLATFESPSDTYTFRKPESENVSLSFSLWTLANNSSYYSSLLYSDTTFSFSVFGVK